MLCMVFFSLEGCDCLHYKCAVIVSTPYFQNQYSFILVPPRFQRRSQAPCQDQQNFGRTWCHSVSQSIRINSQIHYLIFPWALSLYRMHVEFSLKPLYPTMGVENLIIVVQITCLENAFVSQKIESRYFYSCPPTKIFPRFLLSPLQVEVNYSPPRQHYFFRNLLPSSRKQKGD